MSALSFKAIQQAQDLPVTAIDVPEWGGKIHLKPLCNGAADIFSQVAGEGSAGKNPGLAMATTVALMMCDENGKPLDDDYRKIVKMLEGKSSAIVQRVFSEAIKIAGDSVEAGKD